MREATVVRAPGSSKAQGMCGPWLTWVSSSVCGQSLLLTMGAKGEALIS